MPIKPLLRMASLICQVMFMLLLHQSVVTHAPFSPTLSQLRYKRVCYKLHMSLHTYVTLPVLFTFYQCACTKYSLTNIKDARRNDLINEISYLHYYSYVRAVGTVLSTNESFVYLSGTSYHLHQFRK